MTPYAVLFLFLSAIAGTVCAHRNPHRTIPVLKESAENTAIHFTRTYENDVSFPELLIVEVFNGREDKTNVRRKRLKPRETDNTDYGEDDFNPFSDVDETASEVSEYDDIDRTGQMESKIQEDKALNGAQQNELNELITKEAELENELNTAKKLTNTERENADLERKKSTSLESSLIKELLLNRAEKKRRMEEIKRRKASEAKNMENIRKLIQLQNQLQQIKAKMGDPDSDCTVSPCLHGGVCVSKQPSGHECMCPQNYGGASCQRRLPGQIDENQHQGQGVLPVRGIPPLSKLKLRKDKEPA